MDLFWIGSSRLCVLNQSWLWAYFLCKNIARLTWMPQRILEQKNIVYFKFAIGPSPVWQSMYVNIINTLQYKSFEYGIVCDLEWLKKCFYIAGLFLLYYCSNCTCGMWYYMCCKVYANNDTHALSLVTAYGSWMSDSLHICSAVQSKVISSSYFLTSCRKQPVTTLLFVRI